MKKNLILIFLIGNLSGFAISNAKAQFSAGLRFGLNASTYTHNHEKFAPGIHIGPYFRIAIKEKYKIQTDILFSTKGGIHQYTYFDPNGNIISTNVNYYSIPFCIDLPVMFNYKPVAGLYVEGGIQPTVVLTTFVYSKYTNSDFISNSENEYRLFYVSPIMGFGYEFNKVSLGVRGALGITNIYSSTAGNYIYHPVDHAVTLMATFGFKF